MSKSFSSPPQELKGNTQGIGITDIIAQLNKQKIGAPVVPKLERPMTNKFSTDKKQRDVFSFIQKLNDFKIPPN